MINIFQPKIDIQTAINNYREVLESNWIGRGKVTKQFEDELASFLEIEKNNLHTVASCTDAIFNILRTLNLSKGLEVIVPSNSFPAIGSAIVASDLKPVILDIDRKTGNIDLNLLEQELRTNENVGAIFLTDYGGEPVPSSNLSRIIDSDIKLLIDAAASLGTTRKKGRKYIHPDADFVCYSFDAMKLLTTGEGGAVVIKDPELMEKFKEQTYLGLPAKEKSGIDTAKAGRESGWWEYQLTCYGERSIMTDISASLGLAQLGSLDAKINERVKFRELYIEQLADTNCQFLGNTNPDINYSNYFMTITTEKRDDLAAYLLRNDIYTTFRYWPLNKINVFQNFAQGRSYKNTQFLTTHALNLPIHNGLNEDDILQICACIKSSGYV